MSNLKVNKNIFVVFSLIFSCSYTQAIYANDFFYIVGDNGLIEKRDTNANLVGSTQIEEIQGPTGIFDADLSPNLKNLYLAVNFTTTPFLILDTKDLKLKNNQPIDYIPKYHSPFIGYMPIEICSLGDRILLLADESFTTYPEPFSSILVDRQKQRYHKLPSSVFLSKHFVDVAPDRKKIAMLGVNQLSILDMNTGGIEKEYAFGSTIEIRFAIHHFEVDWQNHKAKVYIHKPSRKDVIAMTSIEIPFGQDDSMKPQWQPFHSIHTPHISSTENQMKVAKLIKKVPAKFLKHFSTEDLNNLIGKVNQSRDTSFFSSKNKIAVCTVKEQQSTAQEDPSYHTQIMMYDVHSKTFVHDIDFAERVISILFE